MKVLLDTHALLWWQARSKKLSRRAARTLGEADPILVSTITCWEVATLVAQGRVRLDRSIDDWLDAMSDTSPIRLVPLGARAAIQALTLDRAGFHGDPADRLIYATAADELVPLVTADERIHAFAERGAPAVRLIW